LSAPRVGDGVEIAPRMTGRGEQWVANLFNDMKGPLVEGSYYIAATPTPGTGITLSVATGTTFSDTQALFGINNSDSGAALGAQGKRIYLDFAMWVVTATPTTSTDHQIAHRTDNGQRSSGGTAVSVVNANQDFGNNSVGKVFANPTVVAATGAIRNFGHMVVRKAAAPNYILNDIVVVKFGGIEWSAALGNFTAAAQTIIVVPAPPICIGPNQSYVMNEWATLRAAALSGELFIGWVER
jgi:hypothetical protein